MSRSGYSDDYENVSLYRRAVENAIRGKRGQSFFKGLLKALEVLPSKRLIDHDLERDGEFCALGALADSRNMEVAGLDPEDAYSVGKSFDIAESLAREVVYMNDEVPLTVETPEHRYSRMLLWVKAQIT